MRQAATSPSPLQSDLAARIVNLLKKQSVSDGEFLRERDLSAHFGVSRTPVRGALKLLVEQGLIKPYPGRGFMIVKSVFAFSPSAVVVDEKLNGHHAPDWQIVRRICEMHRAGLLVDRVTREAFCRALGLNAAAGDRILKMLALLNIVARNPGRGWTFPPLTDHDQARREGFAFRRIIEPQLVFEKTFEFDADWLADIKQQHVEFQKRDPSATVASDFFEMNSAFHEGLARLSGNRYLFGELQKHLRVRTLLDYSWEFSVERLRQSIDEHLLIISALEARDPVSASRYILDHLNESERENEESMQKSVR